MIKKLTRYFLLTCYSLVLAEIFLRLLHPIPILPRYVSATDYGIRGNTPNANYIHVTPEYRVNVVINNTGVRSNKEISYIKPIGVTRVVALGDSFMLGYGANYSETFLSQMLNSIPDKHNIEVINLGVSGHGTAEELITLRQEGKKYNPDIVLLSWHGTDFDDNIRSDLFDINNGDLVQVNNSYLPAVKLREFLFSFRLYELVATNSQLYGWLREKASEVVQDLYAIINSFLKPINVVNKSNKSDASNALLKKDIKNEIAVRLLLEIKQEVEAIGAVFLVLDIPRRFSRTDFSSDFPDDNRLSELIIYNPIKDFHDKNRSKLFWEESDGHFTPLGNQIVGQGLADLLIKNKYLD